MSYGTSLHAGLPPPADLARFHQRLKAVTRWVVVGPNTSKPAPPVPAHLNVLHVPDMLARGSVASGAWNYLSAYLAAATDKSFLANVTVVDVENVMDLQAVFEEHMPGAVDDEPVPEPPIALRDISPIFRHLPKLKDLLLGAWASAPQDR